MLYDLIVQGVEYNTVLIGEAVSFLLRCWQCNALLIFLNCVIAKKLKQANIHIFCCYKLLEYSTRTSMFHIIGVPYCRLSVSRLERGLG